MAQPASAPASPLTFVVRDTTRVEMWSFFTPAPGGADPDYAHVGNRLFFGVEGRRPHVDFTVGLQYVQFGGLPTNAIGPGPLGAGGAYFQHAGRSDSRQLYVRAINATFKQVLPGLNVQVGRIGYTSGAEAVSGVPKIEAVKRQRLDSRLVGEFEWSLYQRAFDGVRLDWRRAPTRLTVSAFHPTQGGFEDAAGVSIDDLAIVNGVATFEPGHPFRGAEWQVFSHYYADTRAVTARPDNTGRAAARADVHVTTIGTSLVGAYATRVGQVDALGWFAGQGGSWYEQAHRAWSLGLEGGNQWTRAPWQPWLRAGLLCRVGRRRRERREARDVLPDAAHGATLFDDHRLQPDEPQRPFRPGAAQTASPPRHQGRCALALARAGCGRLVQYGSGATQEEGRIFGFALRPSGGHTGLGTSVEASADYTVNTHFSVNGFFGHISGGDVVRQSFVEDELAFGYLETVVRF